MAQLLEPSHLEQIEREYAGGLSARAIVEIFRPLGVKLSEATFRKYVQAGLLPRSRRVGRKGKHRGSQGLYPVGVVRRINLIKKMMGEGLTLEQIRRSFVWFSNDIEELERSLDAILARHLTELDTRRLPRELRRDLERAMGEARRDGKRLVRRLEHIASQLVAGGGGLNALDGIGGDGP
jgi:DNA-binding transcriptional MerR regulator